MKKLIIFGNKAIAELMHFYFSRDSGYQIAGFTVDSSYNDNNDMCGLNVFDFETLEETHPTSGYELFIAIGPSKMNTLRENKFHETKAKGYRLASYISPHAICNSPVGENSFVGDNVVITPFVDIGDNNFFYDATIISNNSFIENNCYFSPNSYVGTFCTVCDNSILGVGSILKTSVKVAKKTLIGASCYISKNTTENGVYGVRSAELLGSISEKIDISQHFGY